MCISQLWLGDFVAMPRQESRNPTQVPGLDAVLGGLDLGSLTLIVGSPGAGKTVLGSQIVFNAARRGLPTLILSTYSEGNVKLLDHLRGFDFFDETMIGDQIKLLSLPSLMGSDIDNAMSNIVRTIRDTGARLILIDGFQSIAALIPDPHAARRMLSSLTMQLPFLGVSSLITLTGDSRNASNGPEYTTTDVVIGLDYTVVGRKHVRLLEVVKRRGGPILAGQHAYTLDKKGFTVYPRLEVYPLPGERERPVGRAPFGIAELDNLLNGGPNAGTTTILAGAPGTGKSTLALHWALSGATPSEPTLFVTFREHIDQLRSKADSFGLDLASALDSGAVQVMRVPPAEFSPDAIGTQIVDLMRGPGLKRLVIDDIGLLINELGTRAFGYIGAIAEHVYGEAVTGLFVLESDAFSGFRVNIANQPHAALAENVILLQQQEAEGKLHRVLGVLRMRLSDYDQSLRQLVLAEGGVRVLRLEETNPALLAALARSTGISSFTNQT